METIGIVIFVVGIIIIGAILNRRDPEWQAKRLQGKMLFHLFEKRDWKDKEKVKKDMQKEFYEMDKVSSSKIEKLTNNDKKNSKHRQSMKNVLRYTAGVFIIGLLFYWIGGLLPLIFYMLFMISFIYGAAREVEEKIDDIITDLKNKVDKLEDK